MEGLEWFVALRQERNKAMKKLTEQQLADLRIVGEQQAKVNEAKKAKERLKGFIEENLELLLHGIEVKGIGNVSVVLRRELHVDLPEAAA